jgi:ribosomal protein RSM22 (predicted rRNA methylase)
MQLPKELAGKVAAKLDATNISRLRTASTELTNRYHAHSQLNPAQSSDQHLAYIAARMPATYVVCRSVLNQLSPHQLAIKSLLDLGSGPGTASLATLASFPQMEELTLVDKDTQFQSLALDFLPSYGPAIQYELEDITRFMPQKSYDLVVCSYALNELMQDKIEKVITTAWNATQQVLILIEPGTPFGFSIIKQARQLLIKAGAYIVAPCTHHQACPLQGNDWCHFSAHVGRSFVHRLTKNADLSYEHEKYSYIIFARQAFNRPTYRLIKRPIHRSGHVIFDLCGESGVHRSTVSKKQKDHYTQARKLSWGDGWDLKDD